MSTDLHTKLNEGLDARTDAPSLSAAAWLFVIAALAITAFCLGFPQFHYTAALMIAAILRYKNTPGDIFAPVSLP